MKWPPPPPVFHIMSKTFVSFVWVYVVLQHFVTLHIGLRTRYKGQLTVLRNIDSLKTQFCFAIILLHPIAVSHKHLSNIFTLRCLSSYRMWFCVAGRLVPGVSRQCGDTSHNVVTCHATAETFKLTSSLLLQSREREDSKWCVLPATWTLVCARQSCVVFNDGAGQGTSHQDAAQSQDGQRNKYCATHKLNFSAHPSFFFPIPWA